MQKPASRAAITAIGGYVPERILTNADLEKIVDTSDDWIVRRTGIRERRIAAEQEFTSQMCIAAVRDLIEHHGKNILDVDLILVCTHTPDFPFPGVACQVQHHFAIPNAGALDINATCAGFVYGLHLANGLITAGLHRKILVIAADCMSKITDYTDRTTCILFGDGAGAVLVEPEDDKPGFLGAALGADGSGGGMLYRTGLSSNWNGTELQATSFVVQNGREVYKWAVQTVPAGVERLLGETGIAKEQIDWFVPHSANLRMVESICEKSGIPLDRTLYSMVRFGNTSAATIPLSLWENSRNGTLRNGDLVLMYGFGGGLVHGGVVTRWSIT